MKKYKIAILDDYENIVAIDGPSDQWPGCPEF